MEPEKYEEIIEVVDSMSIDDSDKVQILSFIRNIVDNNIEVTEE